MAGCSYSDCQRERVLSTTCTLCGMTYCTHHRLPENHDCVALTDNDILDASDGVDITALPDYTEPTPTTSSTTNNTQRDFSVNENPWLAYLTLFGMVLFVVVVLALTGGWL